MNLHVFLTEWPDGEIMLTGHRISLYLAVSRYKEGLSAEQLHECYPTLSFDTIPHERLLSRLRENRPSSSEGGGAVTRLSLPLSEKT
jgi:hypothetical protein